MVPPSIHFVSTGRTISLCCQGSTATSQSLGTSELYVFLLLFLAEPRRWAFRSPGTKWYFTTRFAPHVTAFMNYLIGSLFSVCNRNLILAVLVIWLSGIQWKMKKAVWFYFQTQWQSRWWTGGGVGLQWTRAGGQHLSVKRPVFKGLCGKPSSPGAQMFISTNAL